MISGKGILYTVLGASAAAVVVGSMLTGGKRSEKLRSMGSGIQNFLGSLKNKGLLGTPSESNHGVSNQTNDR